MSDSVEQVKEALIDAVVELATQRYRGDDPGESERVMRLYYQRIPAQDIEEKEPFELYASAVRHLELARVRRPAETLVSVYNPRAEVDGWSSSHTVIDIVSEDMPFIVDSVLGLLERFDLQVHLLVHPMMRVERDATDELVSIHHVDESKLSESFVHIEVDRVSESSGISELRSGLDSVLADVRRTVMDWIPMRDQALRLATELDGWDLEAREGRPRYDTSLDVSAVEAAEFLRWLADGFFTFMGYREYDFIDDETGSRIRSRPETGLGLLHQDHVSTRELGTLPPQITESARRPNIINLTKANSYATVHRWVPLDYVGIKEIDADGRVTGERRFVGLFTSTVYSSRVQELPIVRNRVAEVLDRVQFPALSHDRSRLLNILQTYPRDELFQTDVETLSRMALAMLDLRDRRQVSLLIRRDTFGRFLVCFVFVPRDRFNTDVRLRISEIMMDAYHGTSCRFSTHITDDPLARLELVIYTDPADDTPWPATEVVQARLSRVIRNWDDDLRAALVEAQGEDRGLSLFARYHHVFSESYRTDVTAEAAVFDIDRLEALGTNDLDVWLVRPLEARAGEVRCKLYRSTEPITLSMAIPLLHHLGAEVIDERPYEFEIRDRGPHYIYDIGLRFPEPLDSRGRALFREALLAAHSGRSESDSLARLVTVARLGWRDVAILRAYTRYFMQLGGRFSLQYVQETVTNHPAVARKLVQFFDARFDPDTGDDLRAVQIRAELGEVIDLVPSLDADMILRSIVSLIEATVRTNAWSEDPQRCLAFKFDPSRIIGIPRPVPAAEIFVYSPRVEGVHLRAGLVARGGLRWSERMEDFRTEVLGLMKAQSVKNSVIVPVGAKGGFVARNLPGGADRATQAAEVTACYTLFVSALLDVTDNLVAGEIVPPPRVVRQDGDDPYLVVAADKGTATFSDLANRLAEDRGFWLGDAFASGGSAGYDHKALAITARGAWRSVESHFRQLGIDHESGTFTVVGIGDMSGDVFGNGMLRSRGILLVAAFDHRHIFIDPSPDAERSFAERERLFGLAGSSWDDYDRTLISTGGGVFPRTQKSIPTTPQIRAALGLDPATTDLSPDELIQAVLRAPVDLFWNGGIGTYVKASTETDAEVGDRANDGVRINADSLRCGIVGEGGNLGFTQLARIEFARRGRINTDAIDNSAGVDCSDHEVNIKILLSRTVAEGDLTRKQRDVLLESMADEVCEAVLANNDAQNWALNVAELQAPGMVDVHARLMEWLEAEAGLDRELEALPTTAALLEREFPLTRPELAVLMAYTKNLLTQELLDSDLPDDPWLEERLLAYFPRPLQVQFGEAIGDHPLRRPLLATLVANDIVNRGGISMPHRLMVETAASASDLARAHLAAWQIYGLDALLDEIRSLGSSVAGRTLIAMESEVERLGERATRWLLRNEAQPLDIAKVVADYGPAVEVQAALAGDTDGWVELGVPASLAARVATLSAAYGYLDLIRVAPDLSQAAAVHGAVEEALALGWLRDRITALPRNDHWESLARSAMRDEFFREHASLTASVLSESGLSQSGPPESGPSDSGPDAARQVRDWMERHMVAVERCLRTFEAIKADPVRDLARVSVAVQALTQLSRAA